MDEPSREPDMHESRERDTHEPPHAFASAEELTAPPDSEPDLTRAIADLHAAPMEARPSAEPADLATARESPPPAQPEPPRRRSTVREPAPAVTASEAPQPPSTQPAAPPAPEPVVTEVGESESTERPRRSGWWSRRIAGG
jgi:ribonuclease E